VNRDPQAIARKTEKGPFFYVAQVWYSNWMFRVPISLQTGFPPAVSFQQGHSVAVDRNVLHSLIIIHV
jgi:hypothetical protein